MTIPTLRRPGGAWTVIAAFGLTVSACSGHPAASPATTPPGSSTPSTTTTPTTPKPSATPGSTAVEPTIAPPVGTVSPARPCGAMPPAATSYTHVVWIFMENHSFDTVVGSGQAPYINSLAGRCGLAANYHNISHPSLPNYVAATSGLPLGSLGPFDSDCGPTPSCSTSAPSIFSQGETWAAYEESMPAPCYRSDHANYAVRHNPPVYYTTLSGCAAHDLPLGSLATALASSSLPAFTFITPDLDDDMHDGTVAEGDAWLSRTMPEIVSSDLYRSGTTVVMITWDEGEGGTSNACALNTTDVGCRVTTLIVSPSTPASTVSQQLFNHYSLLRTTEQILGLPLLGQAATAPSMIGAFHL